jgi:hypothetical protein
MLDSLTAHEIRDLHGLWAWKYIEQEQAVIRLRATTIPPVEFRPAVLYGDPDPPGERTFWSGVGFYAAGALSLAAVTVVSLWAWRAL